MVQKNLSAEEQQFLPLTMSPILIIMTWWLNSNNRLACITRFSIFCIDFLFINALGVVCDCLKTNIYDEPARVHPHFFRSINTTFYSFTRLVSCSPHGMNRKGPYEFISTFQPRVLFFQRGAKATALMKGCLFLLVEQK
jgi:hypothetical protein